MANTEAHSTRPATPEDEAFLCALYTSTREDEVAAWGWTETQRRDFLKQQFSLQHRSYEMQFPGADQQIIVSDQRSIGRILVYRAGDELRLVDIALLPAERGRGVATSLIRVLIAEAHEKHLPVRLQVITSNPAVRLYERLGFRRTGGDDLYFQMESAAPSSGGSATD